MTIDQIQKEVSAAKPVSRRQVIRYLNQCSIRPAGTIRQKPQQYPEDAPVKIKIALGLAKPEARIATMPQLRDVRRRATKRNGNSRRAR